MPDAHFFNPDWGLLPVMFRWGTLQIPSYTVMGLMGLGLSLLLYRYTVSQSPLPRSRDTWLIPFLALCFGALGAKLPSLLTLPPQHWDSTLSLQALSSGKTIIGGLIGGWLGVVFAKRFLGIHEKRGNQFAPALALGLASGRLGCLLQGCCYGLPTSLPWGTDFGDHVLRHPTQGYEILFHLSACGILLATGSHRKPGGIALKTYFIAYLIFRFTMEFIRVEPRLGLGLTGYQWAALGFVPLLTLTIHRELRAGSSGSRKDSTHGGPL